MAKSIVQKMIDNKYSIDTIKIDGTYYSWNDFYIAIDDEGIEDFQEDMLAPNDIILGTFDRNGEETQYTAHEVNDLNLKLFKLKEIK
jgi:hypothetical protein